MSRASLRVIYLGSGWRDESRRARQAKAADSLGALEKPVELSALTRFGVREVQIQATSHDFTDPLDGKKISDLDIQRRLDQLLSAREMTGSEADSVFVILLA